MGKTKCIAMTKTSLAVLTASFSRWWALFRAFLAVARSISMQVVVSIRASSGFVWCGLLLVLQFDVVSSKLFPPFVVK